MANNYVIITPAHNEETYIRTTLDSIVAQSVLPAQWVIVDDGSTDGTWTIIQSYAEKYPWIKPVKYSPDSRIREGGGKVIRAFQYGYDAVDVPDFEFVVKLDADLTLPANYFEEVGKSFRSNRKVGMCGGYLSEYSGRGWKKAKVASYHLRGAIKAYTRACFEDIGGLKPLQNWDFLDQMKAMSLGWEVRILPLEVLHHRRTSSLINRGLRFSFDKGGVYYKDGYDFFLILLRFIPHGTHTKPYIISGFPMLAGFIASWIKRSEKDVDPELEKFIRKFQYNRIKKVLRINSR
jgi:glycosyltransferase involved in cell wall biosynthesis